MNALTVSKVVISEHDRRSIRILIFLFRLKCHAKRLR